MTISAHWRYSCSLFGLNPLVFFGVENTQQAMIFLSVVAAKYVELSVKEGGCVVLDLGRAQGRMVLNLLVILRLKSLKLIRGWRNGLRYTSP